MVTSKRLIAAIELLLVGPAALFLTAVVARTLQPLDHEPAHTAQQLVLWYSGRTWALWVLLIALPLIALLIGSVTLIQTWTGGGDERPLAGQPAAALQSRWATGVIVAATLTAGLILLIVSIHTLAA